MVNDNNKQSLNISKCLIWPGLITEEELQTTINSLGEPMNEKEVKAMIAEADLDGDGKINFKEFQILMDNKEL